MKLLKNKQFIFSLLIILSFQIITLVNTFSNKKITELTSRRHQRTSSQSAQAAPTLAPNAAAATNATNVTVDRLSNSTFRDLNNPFIINPLKNFRSKNRKWDFKLLDKQLEEIYKDMLYSSEKNVRPLSIQAFIQNFIGTFEKCDTNLDNVLSLAEFTICMKSDTFFSKISIPNSQPVMISSYVPDQNYTNATNFYLQIFNILDENKNNYLNFHDYMKLRLMVFSWKHCSVQGPFIEESNFECAIEVASGYRTLSKTAARRLYKLGIELSNSESLRNLDFISFLYISTGMRLFGKINGKEDGDITKSEFNNALDNNILPIRYSQNVINQIFGLVNEKSIQNQGIDKLTFVFLDFSLRLFNVANATRPYYISQTDFIGILANPLFPKSTLGQISKIPSYVMTNNSFQMFAAMNLTQFYSEDDYLMKFLEIKKNNKNVKFSNALLLKKLEAVFSQAPAATPAAPAAAPAAAAAAAPAAAGNSSTPVFNISQVGGNIFNLLDTNNDGWVSFQDFGHMMQLIYIFNKNDVYGKGVLTIGKIIDVFKSYSEYPRISLVNRQRVRRLDMINQDLQINAFELLVIFKIDDIVDYYVRASDKTTLYEVDLKNILAKCGLRYMPDAYLNKCLRGNDMNNIPKYDWECSITSGITLMSQYYEAAFSYTLAKVNGLNITNTVFNNVDPQIK